MDIGLAGGVYSNDAKVVANQICTNFFPQVVEHKGRVQYYLRHTEGLRPFLNGLQGACRGWREINGFAYGVFGETLYRIADGAIPLAVGTVPGTRPVQLANNPRYIAIANEFNKGYVYDIQSGAFGEILDPDFRPVSGVVYLSGYFIWVAAGTREFFISSLNDPYTYNALEFATKESDDSLIRMLVVNHGDLFVIGYKVTEVWRVTANLDFPLQQAEGAEADRGSAAAASAAEMDNSFYYLGNDRVVYRVDGYTPRRVSNHWIETQLRKLPESQITDAYATSYTVDGHYFYALTVGANTWKYDATFSGLVNQSVWHRHQSQAPGGALTDATQWRANFIVNAFGTTLAGDVYTGTIWDVRDDEYTEGGNTIRRVRVPAGISSKDVETLTVSRVELKCLKGQGTVDAPGYVSLEVSKDNGYNWSSPKLRSMGRQGDRLIRCIWRKLGRAVDWQLQFVVTDPVPCALVSAYMNHSGEN